MKPTTIAPFLLADSRLPAGAYAHSAGLEGAVQAGLRADAVTGFMRARLHSVAAADATAAVLAARAVRAVRDVVGGGTDAGGGIDAGGAAGPGGDIDPVRLDTAFSAIDRALAARTPSEPMRAASRLLGRGLVRLAVRVLPDAEPMRILAAQVDPFRPVVLGALVAVLGGGDEDAATITCYEEVQSIASAALKLLPVDPFAATRWVLDCDDDITTIVQRATSSRTAQDIPAQSAPQIEVWAQRHTKERMRLFVS